MSSILSLVVGMLLALPAGFNPYLPLLVVSVMLRYGGRLQVNELYSFLGQTWFVVLAGLFFLVNIFTDKLFVPGHCVAIPPAERDRRCWAGAIHDLGQMILGPLAGALLVGGMERLFPPSWLLLGPMLGALLSGLAYFGKRALRHRVGDRFGPLTNLLLSTLEDTAVVLVSVAAVLLVFLFGQG